MAESNIARIRITYSKTGMLRFIGHLDMQQLWERALRRAELPVRYSQGFNPKIRLNLASALPLGYISRCEVLDFWLEQTVACEIIQAKLNKTLPADLKIIDTTRVANNLPSLQSLVSASEYQVRFSEFLESDQLQEQVKRLLSKATIQRTRRGKTYNLRDYIEHLSVIDINNTPGLQMRLSSRPGATGRPDEVIECLGYDPYACIIERTKLLF